eukprot:TRINITY_DN21929_c0_g1_i2.p3 TRINITY_DN21929_c0_g1~~TRINITY_DN21929_c0_g1_i2.p3  ORF type:complete len:110 (-),score=7.32 TRINITY_DN21929_c0_g1_i2:1010-1339(-)
MVHVDLYRKPLWYGQVNPKGLVPALVMNQQTYIESIDICKQLSENTDLLSKEELQVLDACEEFIHQGLLLVAGKTARRLWEIGEGIQRTSRIEQNRLDYRISLHQRKKR